jgi:1,4-alpha-glucan branching enzyme
MITKTLRKDDTVQVCFYTEALPEAELVHLVGSFDDWDANAHPMRQLKDGRFMAIRRFEMNCRHEYRYLVNGKIWINDEEAESYTPNPYGRDNCVVTTYVEESL